MTRRLAAILVADVVGYSRLMEADEAGTLAALKERRKTILEPVVKAHGGRIVKLMGDGVLIEFASAVNAVEAALELQEKFSEGNADRPEDRCIVLRIGINLGDVVGEGSDIYGDGVNIAARLEGLAEPGGVCISAKLYDEVRGKVAVGFEDMGERQLKNIASPVRALRLRTGDGQVTSRSALVLPDKPSIAVLPFVNMSGDPEQEYFSDGLTEDLITALSLYRSFPVIARNSTFAYKGRNLNIKTIAHELGARYVLEGSVRKDGDRIRVAAQLIDGETGHHVWANRYTRVMLELFKLQDDLSQCIAAIVAPELSRVELKRSQMKRTADLDAWDCYLRGIAFLQQFSKEGNAKARDLLEQATILDPEFAEAYAELASTHHRDLLLQCAVDRDESMRKGMAAARRAVSLDPSSSNAHSSLATAHVWRNEHDISLREARLAVELNPNDALILHGLGNKLDLAGDPEGIPQMVRAQQLNPQDPDHHSQLCFLARAYVNARRYHDAVACAESAITRRPEYPNAYFILAIALGHLGHLVGASAALAKCDELHPGFIAERADWRPYTNEASNAHLLDGLRKAGLPE
jgi:adenylate cyclase